MTRPKSPVHEALATAGLSRVKCMQPYPCKWKGCFHDLNQWPSGCTTKPYHYTRGYSQNMPWPLKILHFVRASNQIYYVFLDIAIFWYIITRKFQVICNLWSICIELFLVNHSLCLKKVLEQPWGWTHLRPEHHLIPLNTKASFS